MTNREPCQAESGRTVGSCEEIVLRDTSAVRRLFGDKWSPVVLAVLEQGPMRRSVILSTVNALVADGDDAPGMLHDSTLARTLRKLTEKQLIDRRQVDGAFPPRVFYALKSDAREYLDLERRLADWARRHGDGVDQTDQVNRADWLDEVGPGDHTRRMPPATPHANPAF